MGTICRLCGEEIDISEGLPDFDIEVIDDVLVHSWCLLRFYNANKNEVNLSDFERKLIKRRE